MPHNYLEVTAGSGTKLSTWSRTKNSQTVHDQEVILGEPYLATYTISVATPISAATANAHLLQIMAGTNNRFRLARFRMWQVAVATAAAIKELAIFRLTTAGTGGTAITPRKSDPADGAAEATAMTLPTSKGTEGEQLWTGSAAFFAAVPSTGLLQPLVDLVFDDPRSKAYEVASGTSNGIALKIIPSDGGTPTVRIYAEIVERAWS